MKVYFIVHPQGPPDKAAYQHEIVAIAEGLKELSIMFKGNLDYWKLSDGTYLINKAPIEDLEDYDLVISSAVLYYYDKQNLIPDIVFSKKRPFKFVFVDASDGYLTPGFSKELVHAELILKAHFSEKMEYPTNFVPWQFGLTTRILKALNPLPQQERENKALSNFRIGHSLRSHFETQIMKRVYGYYEKDPRVDSFEKQNFSKEDMLNWEQSGRRHYKTYYDRLGSSKVSNAVGGYMQNAFSAKAKHNLELKKNVYLSRIMLKLDSSFPFSKVDRIYQFDSWRLWESIASGCCTLHLDFQKYGMKLPVMPKNGEHYLGADFDNKEAFFKIIKDDQHVQEIGSRGSEWVIDNYTPKIVVTRLLEMLDAKKQ